MVRYCSSEVFFLVWMFLKIKDVSRKHWDSVEKRFALDSRVNLSYISHLTVSYCSANWAHFLVNIKILMHIIHTSLA